MLVGLVISRLIGNEGFIVDRKQSIISFQVQSGVGQSGYIVKVENLLLGFGFWEDLEDILFIYVIIIVEMFMISCFL